jgi:hypothetical protein
MSKPITPAEAKGLAQESIPGFVFEAVNHLIATKLGSSSSVSLKQDEIIAAILERPEAESLTRGDVFSNHWLDFEPSYRKAGWEVEYDKPGYCESYEANFTFSFKQ